MSFSLRFVRNFFVRTEPLAESNPVPQDPISAIHPPCIYAGDVASAMGFGLCRSKMMNGIVALHSPPMRKDAAEKNGTLLRSQARGFPVDPKKPDPAKASHTESQAAPWKARMSHMQGNLHVWFWPGTLVYSETNRAPFDLPDAEAELVAGYNVEYARDAINSKLFSQVYPLPKNGRHFGTHADSQPPHVAKIGGLRGGGLPCGGCQRFESAYLQLVNYRQGRSMSYPRHRSCASRGMRAL
uniref:Uncharacterized protein n=1 Tax=Quercus lobata TaxID=97700 RepID=A0A7N2KSH4_QUELO